MLKLTDMKIGTRLGLGFCLVLLCATVLLVLGLWRMSSLHDNTQRIVDQDVASLTAALQMREAGWSMALAMRRMAAPTDATEGGRESARLETILSEYDKAEQTLRKLTHDPATREVLDPVLEQRKQVMPLVQTIKGHAASGNYFDAATMLKTDFSPVHDIWIASLIALADHQLAMMRASKRESRCSSRAPSPRRCSVRRASPIASQAVT